MVNDVVRDPITGEEFTVTWNGGSLANDDDWRYRRQRSDVKDRLTSEAVMGVGLRPSQVKCDVKVDWEW